MRANSVLLTGKKQAAKVGLRTKKFDLLLNMGLAAFGGSAVSVKAQSADECKLQLESTTKNKLSVKRTNPRCRKNSVHKTHIRDHSLAYKK